ncbi:MAG: methenyltetrahydromethanopterin cyclohydrolase [Candidatus Lokiarchaeota archaeon]|nr:methenyltetrahydromethanopterin cyclohydrolase [Candidatus Lokiarchaeota archaeon]
MNVDRGTALSAIATALKFSTCNSESAPKGFMKRVHVSDYGGCLKRNKVDCMSSRSSINEKALQILQDFIEDAEELGCKTIDTKCGATVIDTGIKVPGSIEAGRLIGRISMGGLGAVRIVPTHIEDMTVQAVMVATQEPVIATLGSQLARWRVNYHGFSALGSGPARAKAGIEKDFFEDIDYTDDADTAVLVLETRQYPGDDVLRSIAETCSVSPENLHCVLVPTASVAGSVQIAARIVEIGIYRLYKLGLKPQQIRGGFGVAPFPTQIDDDVSAMGASNDCLVYGGRVHFFIAPREIDILEEIVQKACSSYSKSYGKSFSELYKGAENIFYNMDQQLFSPARISIMDIEAENIYRAGKINVKLVRKALGHV